VIDDRPRAGRTTRRVRARIPLRRSQDTRLGTQAEHREASETQPWCKLESRRCDRRSSHPWRGSWDDLQAESAEATAQPAWKLEPGRCDRRSSHPWRGSWDDLQAESAEATA
jgi:hypothetical protein